MVGVMVEPVAVAVGVGINVSVEVVVAVGEGIEVDSIAISPLNVVTATSAPEGSAAVTTTRVNGVLAPISPTA